MLNLRPQRSAVTGEAIWTKTCVTYHTALQSEMCMVSRAGSPVSGSVTVAKWSMKPLLAMILPTTELAYPMYLEG